MSPNRPPAALSAAARRPREGSQPGIRADINAFGPCIRPQGALVCEHMFVEVPRPPNHTGSGTGKSWI